MKLLFTISVALVLRSNGEKCGNILFSSANCLDTNGCQPMASPPTVYCEATKKCVAYRNDGAYCKQEKTHPIPLCQEIYTQDTGGSSHTKEPWFFCAAGDQDRSLTGATDVGKCMPTESAHGKVCVNFLKWAFMQAVPAAAGPNCFVNGLRSDKNCRKGIATSLDKTAWEVNVEIQGQTKTTSFLVRCADDQQYVPTLYTPTMSANRPKDCDKTFYLRLQDSRANNYNDEYLYCGDNEHNWRPTPFTGSPTSAPTLPPTIKPVTPTPPPNNGGGGEVICGERVEGGAYCNELGKVVDVATCVTTWSADTESCSCENQEIPSQIPCCSNCATGTINPSLPQDDGENYCEQGRPHGCAPEVDPAGGQECTAEYNFETGRVPPPWADTDCLNHDYGVELRCGKGTYSSARCEYAEKIINDREEEVCRCYTWSMPPATGQGDLACDTGRAFDDPRTVETVCSATCWENQVNNSGRTYTPDAPTKMSETIVECMGVPVHGHELYVERREVNCNTRSCAFEHVSAGLAANR